MHPNKAGQEHGEDRQNFTGGTDIMVTIYLHLILH